MSKNLLHYFKSSLLTSQPGIQHGFFTRTVLGTCHSYSKASALKRNLGEASIVEARKNLQSCAPFDLSYLHVCNQIHSNKVAVISGQKAMQQEVEPRADALVSNIPGMSLGITTADCVPVLFADAKNKVIGAAHAGWKGALAGIIPQTINAMLTLGAQEQEIYAAIGPCIRQENYQVDNAFFEQFISSSAKYCHFFVRTDADHLNFDLPAFVMHQLEKFNLAAVNDLKLDTYASKENFYSHRRSTHKNKERKGDLISIVALSDDDKLKP